MKLNKRFELKDATVEAFAWCYCGTGGCYCSDPYQVQSLTDQQMGDVRNATSAAG
nr:CLI_3235 family bacteriocin precursor [Maliibacterium massiliense]